jgi:F0F1-type ATP synthase assembly protein I
VSRNNQNRDQGARTAGLVGQIGCVTGFASILIIGIAFGIGRLLDSLLETNGIFTILFLLGSFPITLYVIVRISLWAIARAQQSNGSQSESKLNENTTIEEETTT